MSDRPAGWFSALVAREGAGGEGDQNGEPFAIGAIRTSGIPPLALSAIGHGTIIGDSLIIGEANLRREGTDVFAIGQVWTDMHLGAEVHKMLLHRGRDMGFSLGYKQLKVGPPTPEQRQRGVTKILQDVLPLELSPVMSPAQPWARLLEIKSSRDDVEAALAAVLERKRAALAAVNREAAQILARGRRAFLRRVA